MLWILLSILFLVPKTKIFGQTTPTLQTSINTQNFPFVILNASVKDGNGDAIINLDPSQFSVCENGVEQTTLFEVTPPGQQSGGGTSQRLVDIVFIQDNSSSLGGEIAAVRRNLFTFISQIENSDIDFSLGLVRFGQGGGGGRPIVEEGGNLTSDATFFRDVVYARNRASGSFEPTFQAIQAAASSFNFRPQAQRIFVVIGDESPVMGSVTSQQATDIAVNNSVKVFALAAPQFFGQFQQVTSATGGGVFNITSDFDFIFSAISTGITQTYQIRYQSSDTNRNGVARNVDVKVRGLAGGDLQASVAYTPGAIPIVSLEQSTKDLLEQAFDPGTPLEIVTMVKDESAPFVQNVRLFYQNVGDNAYQQLTMTQDAGTDIYRATIPQGFANTPAVNFYIAATDGTNAVTSPSLDATNNPFQIAILPNIAPEILHTPVEMASINAVLTINAKVTDATQFVDSVNLLYRQFGDFVYEEVKMTSDGNDNYVAIIPATILTCGGTEYFIKAVDDQSVSTTAGTFDNPFFITGLAEECDGSNPPPPPPPPSCNVAVRTGPNQIMVDNLVFPHNKVVIFNSDFTQSFGEISYSDNFQGNKIFENIPEGKYAIQIQTFTAGFADIRCDTIIYITVTNQGSTGPDCPNLGLNEGAACDDMDDNTINDRVRKDCSCRGDAPSGSCTATVTPDGNNVHVRNLPGPNNRIILFREDYQIVQEFAFSDNVQGEATFMNVANGKYSVKVQSFSQGYTSNLCDDFFEIEVTGATGSPPPPPTNNSICDNLIVTAGNGSIKVEGLTGPNEIVDFMNDQYYIIRTCGHECGDIQTIEGLAPGLYFVNVKSYTEDWQLECHTIIPVEIMIGADGRSRDPNAIIPSNFKLYPNPAMENEVFINLGAIEGSPAQLKLYNQYGQSVWEKTIPEASKFPEAINVGTFQNGLYLLKIKSTNKPLITKKFLISRMY